MTDQTESPKKDKLALKLKRQTKKPIVLIGGLLVGILIILGGAIVIINRDEKPSSETEKTYSSTLESVKDNLKTSDDKRSYATLLRSQDKYDESYNVMLELIQSDKEPQDAVTLLNLCVNNNVNNKEECFNIAEEAILQRSSRLSFYAAYSAGGLLEKIGRKKSAKIAYQQALDVYIEQPKDDEVNLMSKNELTRHTEGL